MKRKLLATLLLGLLSQSGFTQDFDKAKLDRYLEALEANNKFMGSVAVSQGGKTIYTKATGFSDVETKTKASKYSKYRIGSISKMFTTVLVMKAVAEKKLALSQTIEKFFPTIPNANKITLRLLLRHRSGIHNFTEDDDYLTWNTQPKTEKQMVALIARNKSEFEPDSKGEYSNSNFLLLSYILERTFAESYGALLQKYIARPLGLTSTYLGSKINLNKGETKSYNYVEGWKPEAETDVSIPLGAGGIVSTALDLVTFSEALFGGKLLKTESLDQMKTIQDDYGMGLFKIPFGNKTGYGHNGRIDGFSSVLYHFADGDVSYAMLSNGSHFENNNISIAILSAVYNRPYEIPDFKTYEVTSETLDIYLGTYSSTEMPLRITITKEGKTLRAQATGQSSFPLEATEKDLFKFDGAGVVLEFQPAAKTMVLRQGGGRFTFTKD